MKLQGFVNKNNPPKIIDGIWFLPRIFTLNNKKCLEDIIGKENVVEIELTIKKRVRV